MMRPDLHLHTTASDGVFTAWQMARLVQKADVTLFSVTDHDTLAALPAAADAACERGLAFIPGVEISTEGDREVHILGYGVQPDDPVLTQRFGQMARDRQARIQAMAQRLSDLGMPLPEDSISSRNDGSVGRPHLARALVEKGYAASVADAFDRYLGKGRPAYVPRVTMTAAQAVSLLRQRGAVPVLAHPGLLKTPMEQVLPMLRVWIDAGLQGIEVYHPANRGQYAQWDRLARQNGLLVTGGSDYHDGSPRHGQIGETAGEWPRAGEDGWALYRLCRR